MQASPSIILIKISMYKAFSSTENRGIKTVATFRTAESRNGEFYDGQHSKQKQGVSTDAYPYSFSADKAGVIK